MYPCDRKTMFGPAGAHAHLRSKEKDHRDLNRTDVQLHPNLLSQFINHDLKQGGSYGNSTSNSVSMTPH